MNTNHSDRPLILITNDDGIGSPGLRAVVEAVASLGELLVVAPKTQQTAMGRSFRPSEWVIETYDIVTGNGGSSVKAYTVDATPAQAVRAGVLLLADRRPDLLISGINYGENIGLGVTISGTVGAAIEGASFNIPGLAVSLETGLDYHFSHSEEIDFTVAGHFTHHFAQKMLTTPLPPHTDILKLEIPSNATQQTPWRITRVARQNCFRAIVKEEAGVRRFEGYTRGINFDKLKADSDAYALVVDRVVSLTPLTIDLTADRDLSRLEIGDW